MNIIPYDRDQPFLLPPDLRDWLPEEHLAWLILETVEALDLKDFYKRLRLDGRGGKSYDPAMLLGLLLYAYSMGVQSSREIERLCEHDIAFRVLAGNRRVDHTTICRFRQRYEAIFKDLFVQVLEICFAVGMGKVGTVALDGTKLKGNASLSANRTRKHLAREVDTLLAAAEATDRAEDERFGADNRGDELPKTLRGREDRLQRLQAAKERLDAEDSRRKAEQAEKVQRWEAKEAAKQRRGRRPKDPDDLPKLTKKANMTDPDSRTMKTRNGYIQGYNGQAVVNEEQLILVCDLTQESNDVHQLHPMLDQAQAQCGQLTEEPIKVLLADAGYMSEANLDQVEACDPEMYIPVSSGSRRLLEAKGKQAADRCHCSKLRAMEAKIRSDVGQEIYAQRGWMVEGVFGAMKACRGLDGFSRRGLSACESEWTLFSMTHNLLKLHKYILNSRLNNRN